MLFNENAAQDKFFAVTSSSGGEKYQLLWTELNEYDNGPEHFWATFAAALAAWNIEFALYLRQLEFPRSPSQFEAFAKSFAKYLSENPLIFVLQNTHLIEQSSIHFFLHQLIQTKNLYLILLYNEDSVTTLSKAPDSNKFYAKHSCLTFKEEWDFYVEKGFDLTEDEVYKARDFTEGWRSAVKLVADLLKEQGRQVLQNLFVALSQWYRAILPRVYTVPELERLLGLAMLDEFPLELIQHLAGWSGEILPSIMEDSSLIRYNPNTNAYHYAKFLQPLLNDHQVLVDNKFKQDFFIQVADWYKGHGLKIKAVKYYQKASAYKKMIQVINQWEFPASRELASCYIEAINGLPPAVLDKNLLLHVIRSHMLSTLYRYKDAYYLMYNFCKKYDQGDDTPENIRYILGEAYLVLTNACTSLLKDDEMIFSMFKRSAELLPNGSSMIKAKINLFSDCSVIRLPNKEAGAMKKYMESMKKLEPYLVTATGGGWAGCAALAEAEMNYYIRDFKNVETPARKAIVAALARDQHDLACSACFLLMRFYFAKGNYEKTMESFHLLQQYSSEAHYSTFFSMPDLAESWLQLKLGKKHNAAGWIRDESKYEKKIKPWNYGRDRIIRSYYLLADQQYEALEAYTDSSIGLLAKRGYNLLNLSLLMMKVLAQYELNKKEACAITFEEVYEWCHPNKIIMPIVEFSGAVRPIIDCYIKSGRGLIPMEWLEEIGKKATSYYVYQYNIRKLYNLKMQVKTSLIEELTGSEQKLLLLISRGMTAREIAQLQGKTLSAIKGMARRLYVKIGAANAAEAIRIATENNIEEIVHM